MKINSYEISLTPKFQDYWEIFILCYDGIQLNFTDCLLYDRHWHGLSSVQFSRSVVSNSLWPHELQHARHPCPSPAPGVHPNSCPLSQWCHPTISSSVVPFSSRPQSFPASGSFQMSQLFALCGQSIGVSASASVLPMNTQDWSPWEMEFSLKRASSLARQIVQ